MLTYEVLKDRYKSLRKSHEDIYNELIKADKEIKHLNKQLDQALKDYDELQQRIYKAIKYINNNYDEEPHELYGLVSGDELLNILRGVKYVKNKR